jgi:uncharacterized protein (DUF924 family)
VNVTYRQILSLWFGEFNELGMADSFHVGRWWKKDEAFDQALRDRFGAVHTEISAGGRTEWLETVHGKLATVIVLDQLSRNLFRDSPKMYANDPRALSIALEVVDAGQERELWVDERSFFYLPLMHAEDRDRQRQCLELFTAFREELSGAPRQRVEASVRFALDHKAIVDRFGRFPHRNAILGRASTAEELAFLREPGSSF